MCFLTIESHDWSTVPPQTGWYNWRGALLMINFLLLKFPPLPGLMTILWVIIRLQVTVREAGRVCSPTWCHDQQGCSSFLACGPNQSMCSVPLQNVYVWCICNSFINLLWYHWRRNKDINVLIQKTYSSIVNAILLSAAERRRVLLRTIDGSGLLQCPSDSCAWYQDSETEAAP